MPDHPVPALAAVTEAIRGELKSSREVDPEALARVALEAAAPILAETVAQKITVHMEGFGPHHPSGALEPVTAIGRDYRAWRRHLGIAARVAAGAFYTDEDKMRLAAEAIGRGEFIGCNPPEVPGKH